MLALVQGSAGFEVYHSPPPHLSDHGGMHIPELSALGRDRHGAPSIHARPYPRFKPYALEPQGAGTHTPPPRLCAHTCPTACHRHQQ